MPNRIQPFHRTRECDKVLQDIQNAVCLLNTRSAQQPHFSVAAASRRVRRAMPHRWCTESPKRIGEIVCICFFIFTCCFVSDGRRMRGARKEGRRQGNNQGRKEASKDARTQGCKAARKEARNHARKQGSRGRVHNNVVFIIILCLYPLYIYI